MVFFNSLPHRLPSDQDSLPLPLLHLSPFPCSSLLSLSHPLLPLSLIHRRSIRTLSSQGDQLPLSIVSESRDLVLSGLVSTPLAKSPHRHASPRPKSGRRFSDRYTAKRLPTQIQEGGQPAVSGLRTPERNAGTLPAPMPKLQSRKMADPQTSARKTPDNHLPPIKPEITSIVSKLY